LFTGLIEGTGKVVNNSSNKLIVELSSAVAQELTLGDSIAVNGVCLTVTELNGPKVSFDVSHESREITNLSQLGNGAKVNIERSMSASGRFHGHFVTGHIDSLGKVLKTVKHDDYIDMMIGINDNGTQHSNLLVPKGSIAINGVSLTINDVAKDASFRLTLIPHTLKMTNLIDIKTGDRVNIEFDVLAKYVDSMLNGRPETLSSKASGVTEDFLKEHGYAK